MLFLEAIDAVDSVDPISAVDAAVNGGHWRQ